MWQRYFVAKIFCDKLNVELEIVNNLREINTYGVMSGVNKDDAKKLFRYFRLIDSSAF